MVAPVDVAIIASAAVLVTGPLLRVTRLVVLLAGAVALLADAALLVVGAVLLAGVPP